MAGGQHNGFELINMLKSVNNLMAFIWPVFSHVFDENGPPHTAILVFLLALKDIYWCVNNHIFEKKKVDFNVSSLG